MTAIVATAAIQPAVPAAAIIGGHDATQTYPAMVSMQIFKDGAWRHDCGGTLIRSKWVVTADHCVAGRKADQLRVLIGSTNVMGGELRYVQGIVEHPNATHTGDGGAYDIALLQLAGASTRTPMTILGTALPSGAAVRQLGWGYYCTPPDDRPDLCRPTTLQELDNNLLDDSTCSHAVGWNGAVELCVYVDDQHTIAYGDSGSPLLRASGGAWLLAGLTSRDAGNGTAYTDVTALRSWIDSAIAGFTLPTCHDFMAKKLVTTATAPYVPVANGVNNPYLACTLRQTTSTTKNWGVVGLQRNLNNCYADGLGFTRLDEDGEFGSLTDGALRKLQTYLKGRGYPTVVDGIYDGDEYAFMNFYSSSGCNPLAHP